MRPVIIRIGAALLLLASALAILGTPSEEDYQLVGDTMRYATERSKPEVSSVLYQRNDTFEIRALRFATRPFLDDSTTLAALLVIPTTGLSEKLPGVVLLPGGGGTKESRLPFAYSFARQRYVVLVLDQRGIGQSGGISLSPEEDYQVFQQGREPLQHLAVYDALRAFDVLALQERVDRKRIFFAGESMGGRYALIAAALERRSAGVIAISTSGFHIPQEGMTPAHRYLRSIDPDHYLAGIAPHPLVMIHDPNDTVIPLADAQETYALAGEPKAFIEHQGCNHGYCPAMDSSLEEAVAYLQEQTS